MTIDRNKLILLALERRTIPFELVGWARSVAIDVLERLVEDTPVTLDDTADDTRRAVTALRDIYGVSDETAAALAERVIATSMVATDDANTPEAVLQRHAAAIAETVNPDGDRELAEIAKRAGVSVKSIVERRRQLDDETNDD